MFRVQVTGLEHINELSEMVSALSRFEFRLVRSISGEIDLEASFRDLDAAIERKLQRFSHNPLAAQLAASAKQQFREQIRGHAEKSRRRTPGGFEI
jgi:hypothetical protein